MIRKKLCSALLSCIIAFSLFGYVPGGTVSADDGNVAIDENNFPDYFFRDYVWWELDTSSPWHVLTPDEISAVTSLDISDMNISDLSGIELFTNLGYLECYSNPLESLDLSGMSELYYVDCRFCDLVFLDVANCTGLREINCRGNSITGGADSIDLTNCDNMTNLYIDSNELNSTEFMTSVPNLEILDCSHNHDLTTLDISGLPRLNRLDCSATGITSLDVKDHPALQDLTCWYCNIDSLDVSGMTTLNRLFCGGSSSLTSVNVTNCPNLLDLTVRKAPVTELDLTGDYNLLYLDVDSCELSGLISFGDFPLLACLRVQGNSDLRAIDIRNNERLLRTYETCVPEEPDDDVYDCPDSWLRYNRAANGEEFYSSGYNCRMTLGSSTLDVNEALTVIITDEQYDEYIAAHTTPASSSEEIGGSSTGGSGSSGSTSGNTPAPASGGSSSTAGSSTAPSGNPGISSGNSGSSNGGSSAPTSAPAATTERGVAGFVERLYTVALGRASDPVGKQDWIDAITLRGETGASCARGFLYSPEFLNKGVSNEDFVTVLYRTFFDREPDQAGFNAWVAVLNNGTSKEEVIEGFINSTEWANLCLFYGIRSGGTGVPSVEMEPNQDTIDFATRLYTTCLGRSADEAGLMAWARQLANQRDTGSGAARGFFFSSEFTGQNVSNGEFVTRLYRTFMDREPDQSGFDAWVAQLDSGVSREAVFDGFAQSVEFARICAQYGIVK